MALLARGILFETPQNVNEREPQLEKAYLSTIFDVVCTNEAVGECLTWPCVLRFGATFEDTRDARSISHNFLRRSCHMRS